MGTFKCVRFKVGNHWVTHYPGGRPTNAQRIQAYHDGVKRVENALRSEAYARDVAIVNEQTAKLVALVIERKPVLDANIRKYISAIRDSADLPRASVLDAINKYKDYLWKSDA